MIAPAATWVGDLYAVETPRGLVAVRRTPFGVAAGELVSAHRRHELGAVTLDPSSRWAPLVAVRYDRDRPAYGARYWRHSFPAGACLVAFDALGAPVLDGPAELDASGFLADDDQELAA
jgi:hypothetical protein